ncbi:MAG: glycosyltransferase, partial [Paludibacteraceae bacterium]|nr:glycosyltransferase [Paludibacteraceae bacterium]
MRQLTVVIVTYNAKQYLLKCLEYLGKASEGMDVEVIVVDNASADGSEEAVRDAYPNVEYIYSTENLGFAKA